LGRSTVTHILDYLFTLKTQMQVQKLFLFCLGLAIYRHKSLEILLKLLLRGKKYCPQPAPFAVFTVCQLLQIFFSKGAGKTSAA